MTQEQPPECIRDILNEKTSEWINANKTLLNDFNVYMLGTTWRTNKTVIIMTVDEKMKFSVKMHFAVPLQRTVKKPIITVCAYRSTHHIECDVVEKFSDFPDMSSRMARIVQFLS